MNFSIFIKLFIILGYYALLQNSYAEGFKFKKYASEFMDIGVDARAQAMGGAFTGIPGGVTSSYYNAAGMFNIKKTQVSFMHTQQIIASVNYDFLAIGHRQGENRVLAISLIRLGIDNIMDSRKAQRIISQTGDWNIDWSQIKNFNTSDYIFTFSIAQKWKNSWIIGANFKLIRRNLAEYNANGLGFDVGFQKNIMNNFVLGTNIKNITTTLLIWNTGEKELVKPAMYLGTSYNLKIDKLKSCFVPVVDVVLRGENRRKSATANLGSISFNFAAGLEYSYYQVLFLRVGIDEISRLNTGIGLKIPHVRIDYAFTSYSDELGNSHRIGLIINL